MRKISKSMVCDGKHPEPVFFSVEMHYKAALGSEVNIHLDSDKQFYKQLENLTETVCFSTFCFMH